MSVSSAQAGRLRASHVLMLASGFAGLGYQVVWTQQCALWLGHESAAVLAVVAAFFGGLALGALSLGPRIERSALAVRWYGACEALIACWSLLLLWLMPGASNWLLELTGAQPTALWQWAVAFAGTFVLLLPATAAMGATLPAMERLTSSLRREGRSIAALYASNTAGAVLGVLATAFYLVPEFGLSRTAGFCAALNLLCAALAFTLWARPAAGAAVAEALAAANFTPQAQSAVLARLGLSGLLGIGYEVLVVRVLSQVTEDTVYTFAMLLAVYLVGTAFGAAAYHRWLAKPRAEEGLSNQLLGALAGACLMGTLSLWASQGVRDGLLQAYGGGMAAAVAAEASLALLAFGLPTLVMGALFSHWCQVANEAGISFGRALGVNTLGASLAPWLFGVILAPFIGPKLALLLIAAGYLLLCSRQARWSASTWLPAGALVLIAVMAPPLAFVEVPEGAHVVSYREGAMAAVSVVEDRQGVSRLRINNRQQEGSSASRLVDGRQALLPLLLHPAPRHALFLGLGTGVTASVGAEDADLQVDAVELLPEVIAASGYFARPPAVGAPAPHLYVMAADARRYVRASQPPYDLRYDVIISDNFHPARSGSGSLYTVEHFQAVRQRLASGGVFCQWLPMHQLDNDTLRSIVQSFLLAYPHGSAILASNSLETPVLGLIGRADDARFELQGLKARLVHARFLQSPAEFGIEDELALLGSFVAGPRALAHFAGQAPANTDDLPVVAYRAPRITYAPDSLPRERLLALLAEVSVEPTEILDTNTDPSSAARLSAYFKARDQFIEAGRHIHPGPNLEAMLAQVKEPLLAVLHTSPDFRPAYNPLFGMAMALARSDPQASRELLTELAQAQPARPEAEQALKQLTAPGP